MQSSNRQAPEIADVAPAAIKAQIKKRGSLLSKRKLEETKPNLENRGQQSEMLKRVRGKQAKRKAEEDEIAQRPNKAVCEREERMAEVQLKAYWACYPLHPSPASTEAAKKEHLERDKSRMTEQQSMEEPLESNY